MSFKGFQKAAVRAPQSIKQRFNMGEITKDAIYIDAELRFADLERDCKRLHDESEKYFKAIHAMLDHQIGFSTATAEVYKPISGRASNPDSFFDAVGNEEGIRACEEYVNIVNELKASLAPELEMIEQRVVKPADELMEIIKVVRKAAVKRDHKQLDYDRHRASLKKLEDKKDKSLKDEKALYKAENDVDMATQEYEYFNNVLKEELPELFRLEREFIIPLFQSFYYMQLNVFYTLHEKMQAMDIGYFNLTLGIEEAFEAKRGDIQSQAEALSITKFKTTGGPRPARPNRLALKDRPNRLAIENGRGSASADSSPARHSFDQAPPAYDEDTGSPSHRTALAGAGSSNLGRSTSMSKNWGSAAAAKAKPPPPKAKPSALAGKPAVEQVQAMYDYEPQGENDLGFKENDLIEIVKRNDDTNSWWTGKLYGRTGEFPANYVKFL